MASDEPGEGEHRITTDPEQIEAWARETNAVPVREGGEFRLVDEGRFDADRMERLDWDAFEAEIKDTDRVVVYHEGARELDVRRRDEAMAHLEDEDVEDRLLSGEVVTGTITESATVERTIVEEAEIESEIVDSEVIDRQVVDAQLVSRECTQCDVEGAVTGENFLDLYGAKYFQGESDDQLIREEDVVFELEVDEAWAVTVEEREQFTVESRIADVEVDEADAVEDVDVLSDADLQEVQRDLLSSGLFETDFTDLEDVDHQEHAIESDVHEGDAVRTTLTQTRTIDREVAMAHRITAEGTESERTNVATANEEVVASTLADRGQSTADAVAGDTTGTVDTAAAASSDESATGGRFELDENDEGKTVVDAAGEEVGVVTAVDDGVASVDPEPGLTERVMARFGWGDADDDDYAITPEEIGAVTDDEIQLAEIE